METDAGRRRARLAARRKAWQVMSKATRRRLVRQAVEDFARWAQQRNRHLERVRSA